ncbi:MAG: DUF6062 family protein [Lachnospiraceae bacterium]|nr:DUF6062 family protein [Lachnospiraceae bacterium]
MKEKLYTIPVNDAFSVNCECPICAMKKKLEEDAVDYTMGPSYMEDDTRMKTDQMGFCEKHMRMLWEKNNRLGLALISSTHMKKLIQETETRAAQGVEKGGFFKKVKEDPVVEYLKQLEASCFVCERIRLSFERYIMTICYLWKSDGEFRKKYEGSKGFCNEHYRVLLEHAPLHLSGKQLEEFREATSRIYLENMKRVLEDVEWFINKFDYRYQDEPWKNSEDAMQRTLTKLNGIFVEEDGKLH